MLVEAHLNAEETATAIEQQVSEDKDRQGEHEEIDELYKEVQKELHTRFKNMFEGEMLLPNLDFNPAFEGKVDGKLLSLEDEAREVK
mmetsp:Transcript_20769/g.25404  ORF Transcript_20769/g.25404 Transcript_20769/m.25404 type:complete len:87 (-) Transcript_20769:314-574(-)